MKILPMLPLLRRFLIAFLPLVMLAVPVAAPAQQQQARDWSRTVTLGANGAYILGNPNAPTKLIEYMSYTCPHCAAFAKEATAPLKTGWIRRGLVSIEYRNFVRDAFDLSAALLARCGGATHFLANHEAIFANYEPWMARARSFADSPEAAAASSDQVAQLTLIADKTGLFTLLAARGLTPAAQRACIADRQAMSQVLNLTAGSWDNEGFSGTPFFVLNGRPLADIHDWASLRPRLPALPASRN